ncbi:MAG: 4Fe-4S dicluster domain-containing protein [Acidobacteriota bacterium]|nr:4Fe-4S dicluster domain-containing protein [Acidobacteriota bacterium]
MQVYRFEADALNALIATLRERGYKVIAPTPMDGAVVLGEITDAGQLPRGYCDEQEKGVYRLKKTDRDAFFDFNVGPRSPKRYLFPTNHVLWRSRQENGRLEIYSESDDEKPFAFLGIRPCEMKAVAVQDRVLSKGPFADRIYSNRRQKALFIPVDCTRAGKTCFCTSMGGGPEATEGYHLALTEVIDENRHFFLARPGEENSVNLLECMQAVPATAEEIKQGRDLIEKTAACMGREVNTAGVAEMLAEYRDHPHWEEIGKRCMNCTNCTMVCPTCFCFEVEDHNDLTGQNTERTRQWDSCFNLSFTYQHGGSVRHTNKARYRQWLTHKFSAWHDQFGESGCVGCGRCITWCPVGIDVTEEIQMFQEKTS